MSEIYTSCSRGEELADKRNTEGLNSGPEKRAELGPTQKELSRNAAAPEKPEEVSLEENRCRVEQHFRQSVQQILEDNGKYMSEQEKRRIEKGLTNLTVKEYSGSSGVDGCYLYTGGKSYMTVYTISESQMERTAKHETNHFSSWHSELIAPDSERHGYHVCNTVGTRCSRWFHNCETGQNSDYETRGRGLNEGLTTMFTNEQLAELSPQKGLEAERAQVYAQATDLCVELRNIIGADVLKEAYYGGKLEKLQDAVEVRAGKGEYEHLCGCLDRCIDTDYITRVEAMREAQDILALMHERSSR